MTTKRFIVDGDMVRDIEGKIPTILTYNKKQLNEFLDGLNELNDENEQLKQELAIYRKLVSCSNCKYQDYDWYDDGDEFEVCDKGNDVTEGICKEWEER